MNSSFLLCILLISYLEKATHYVPPFWVFSVARSNDILYLAEYNGGVEVVKFGAGTEIISKGRILLSGNAVDVWVKENILYVAEQNKGVSVYNIKNPLQPDLIKRVKIKKCTALKVKPYGNRIAIVCGKKGVLITDSEFNTLYQFQTDKYYSTDLFWTEGYIYLLVRYQGIYIFPFAQSTIKSPLFFPLIGNFNSFCLAHDNRLILACGNNCLKILKRRTPLHITLEKHLSLPFWVMGVECNSSEVFIAGGDGGVGVLDASTGELLDSYDTRGWSYEIKYYGGELFVSDGWNGLLVLKWRR